MGVSLDEIAAAFGFDERAGSSWMTLGKVVAVNNDGTISAKLGGAMAATACAAYCSADVGDAVLVVVSDGTPRAIARQGGDGGGGSAFRGYELVEDTRASNVATITGASSRIGSLANGTRILLHLQYTTAAASELALTLADGTTVTKHIYRYGSTRLAASVGYAGAILALTYLEPYSSGGSVVEADGAWVLDSAYDTNTNTIGYQLRTNLASLMPNFAGRRYRLWFTSADNTQWVCANKSTATNATTVRTLDTATKINPLGPIVYRTVNGTADTTAVLEVNALWQQYHFDLRYTTGPMTLIVNTPVYLKCTPNTDGSAYMHSIVQTLPSTEDGYIYIYLGIAYSTTNMELRMEHPVYEYRDGAVRQWTNAKAAASFGWSQLAQVTGSTSASLDLTGVSEVMVVADVTRSGAHHFFSTTVPVQAISGTAAEYKLGGYIGSSASTSGGAWCSMASSSFSGVAAWINNSDFLSATEWTVYAR